MYGYANGDPINSDLFGLCEFIKGAPTAPCELVLAVFGEASSDSIPFGTSFVSAQVTNVSPNYMGYGLCGSVYAEQRAGDGWERVRIIPAPGFCDAVGHSLGGFGSTAMFTLPLAADAPAGEYRLRMPFNHKSETFVSTSNVFTIQ